MKTDNITLKTNPEKIIEKFKEIFEKGGTINLDVGNGNYIFAVGAQPMSILCKLQDGVHYSYQRDKRRWVEL